MSDFPLLPPGIGSPLLRPPPAPDRTRIAPVAGTAAGGGPSGRMDRDPSGDPHGRRPAPRDPDGPAGPPPAFSASILERETDLRRILAELSDEAANAETAPGTSPEGDIRRNR